MKTIKVDEQGKLYWWDGTRWIEIAEKDQQTLALIIFNFLLLRADSAGSDFGIQKNHTYTIEADGRFEVREYFRPKSSSNFEFPWAIRDKERPKEFKEKTMEYHQLAYWITDKHEEKIKNKLGL